MRLQSLVSVIVAVSLALLVVPASLQAVAPTNPRQAEILINQIEVNALDVREHAARVLSYTRFPGQHSWQVHAMAWDHAKARVQELANLLDRYNEVRPNALKGQNEAVNAIIPLAAKLAKEVDKAIRIVNEDKRKLAVKHQAYEDVTNEVYSLADRIVAACSLAEHRLQVSEAMKKLGLDEAEVTLP